MRSIDKENVQNRDFDTKDLPDLGVPWEVSSGVL